MDEDYYDPYDAGHEICGNCGDEGFVYGCSWDWQCDTWDGDSCLCTRRCDWCNPPKPAKDGAELSKILGDAPRMPLPTPPETAP